MTPEQRRQALITTSVIAAGLLAAWAALGAVRGLRWLIEAGVVAVFLSFVLQGPVEELTRRSWNRRLAAGGVVLVVVVAVAATLWVLIPGIAQAGAGVISNLDVVISEAGDAASTFGMDAAQVEDTLSSWVSSVQETFTEGGNTGEVAATAGRILVQAATALFLLYYLLSGGDAFRNGMVRVIKDPRRRRIFAQTWDLTLEKTTGFFTGTLALAVVAGIYTAGLAAAVGLESPLGLGAWAMAASMLPFMGGWIAGALPVADALIGDLAGGVGLGTTFVVLAGLVAFQALDNYLLRPRVMSRTVEIPAVLAFIAIVGGASIGGLVGAVLAIPVTAVGYVFITEWMHTRPELGPELRRGLQGTYSRGGGGQPDPVPADSLAGQAQPSATAETPAPTVPESRKEAESSGEPGGLAAGVEPEKTGDGFEYPGPGSPAGSGVVFASRDLEEGSLEEGSLEEGGFEEGEAASAESGEEAVEDDRANGLSIP